jgi:hypothetical protein
MQTGYGQARTWSATTAKPANNLLSLDILIDRSGLEVFVGDGTAVAVTVFPRYEDLIAIEIRLYWPSWTVGMRPYLLLNIETEKP